MHTFQEYINKGGPWKRAEIIGDALLIQADCLEILPTLDKVDAVVTDPPYGIGFAAQPTKWQRRNGQAPDIWDNQVIDGLFLAVNIAEHLIIWGGNYYDLPPVRGWLSWFKPDAPPSMGNFELAWTNLNRPTRQISHSISATNSERVGHPTQKPIRVMAWCLSLLPDAKTILDPFMGSGTTGVACANLGRKFIGVEINSAYFDIACQRIEDAYHQKRLFPEQHEIPSVQGVQSDIFQEREKS